MKNLEIFLSDNTKVFEAVISKKDGIVAVAKNNIMPSLEDIVISVIEGKYKIEFENDTLDTSTTDDIFQRIEMFKKDDTFNVVFDIITPSKVLEYVYCDTIKVPVDVKKIATFFNIEVSENNKLPYDGIAINRTKGYTIEFKKGDFGVVKERFTIGHELGHIFLHFPTNSNSFMDSGDEYQAVARGASSSMYANYKLEQEAESFAAQLLIPEKEIRNYIENSQLKPMMSELKKMFKVSNGAIFRTLKSYNLLDKVVDDCRWW